MLEKRVKVLIHGAHPGTLVPEPNEYTYVRVKDGTRFVFDIRRCSGKTQELVDVALALVDASHEVDDSELSAGLQLVQQSNSRRSYIMFMDAPLATGDDHEYYLWYLLRRARLSARYDLDCLPVDADMNTSGGPTCLLNIIADAVYPVARRLSWTRIATQVQEGLLDMICRCLSLPSRNSLPDVSHELATINSDDDVRRLSNSSFSQSWENDIKARLPEDIRDLPSFPVHRITPSLVTKSATISERVSMEFVRQYTTIPVPRVHRADLRWLVMDRIDGETLLSCWESLSWFRQLRVACTLRLYVKQLRALRRSYPGNLVNGGVSGLFFQYDYSTEELGPFTSPDALRRFCTYAAYKQWEYRSRFNTDEVEAPPEANFDWSPVFVHGDLNMSNILLDREGTVWLIDWAWAGYYPACIEALAMRHSNVNVLLDVVPSSWDRYGTFIAGSTTAGMEKFWYRVLASMRRL